MKHTYWVISAAVLACGLGCQGGAGEAAETAGGYDSPATVQLNNVVVGLVGTGILLQNLSDETLQNVEIIVNESDPSGGYRFRTASIPPNSTQTYLGRVFKTASGEALDPMSTRAGQFTVYADTSRGRGAWSGGYADQQ